MEACLFFYLCGLFSYVVSGDYVLLMLLSLEFMAVGVFLLIFCGLGVCMVIIIYFCFFLLWLSVKVLWVCLCWWVLFVLLVEMWFIVIFKWLV
uniref:NADH dehydrogenase subunit 4L n=1 Tax=Pseudocellus gertschi TaxID=1329481 RepID=W5R4D9_9ARAC|nr:NADH dehydrogenase subunit 4L [Pseudocellus gertschi]AGL11945.1 NADH dehydrogenase subunit 4L [Pseudocellus gertschi]